MYFDSWSASYFFWVIICFAVWGIAGFSVYGVFNIFAAKRRRQKGKGAMPLSLEKIREIKMKAEREAAERAYKDSCEKNAEEQLLREAVSLVWGEDAGAQKPEENAEAGTNDFLGEAEEISVEEEAAENAPQPHPCRDAGEEKEETREERSEKLNRKLEEIYRTEVLSPREHEAEEEDGGEEPDTGVPDAGAAEGLPQEKETAEPCAVRAGGWKEIDDIYRSAFRGEE